MGAPPSSCARSRITRTRSRPPLRLGGPRSGGCWRAVVFDHMAFRFEDFLAPVDPGLVGMCLQASWSWFEPLAGRKPVAMTLFGDVFLIDRENAIYFLDTNFGELERVAT